MFILNYILINNFTTSAVTIKVLVQYTCINLWKLSLYTSIAIRYTRGNNRIIDVTNVYGTKIWDCIQICVGCNRSIKYCSRHSMCQFHLNPWNSYTARGTKGKFISRLPLQRIIWIKYKVCPWKSALSSNCVVR